MFKKLFKNREPLNENEEIVRLNKVIEELKQSHEQSMQKKLKEIKEAYFEFEDTKKEKEKLNQELALLEKDKALQIKKLESTLTEYSQIISDQRQMIEKCKRYIHLLEGKIEALSFEIKSILQIDKPMAPTKSVPLLKKDEKPVGVKAISSFDLKLSLKKYITLAENFKETQSRFFGMMRRSSFDLRHLFENFQEEKRIIFIYSYQENKILFVNDLVKQLLHLSPDKFKKEFFKKELEAALHRVIHGDQEKYQLAFNKVSIEGLLGGIKEGPFANHAIGIFSIQS